MGRPEPCVLFAQNFGHPHLDEYVDEAIFSEPIVITGCEFLEQSVSSAALALTLVGATSPPSFALELFVHCEGETRFRRLCQPFLYSHSSSNVLEVETMLKILEIRDAGHKVVTAVVSAVSSYISGDICKSISARFQTRTRSENVEELQTVINEARKGLFELYKVLGHKPGNASFEWSSDGNYLEMESDVLDSKELVNLFNQYFHFKRNSSIVGDCYFSQSRVPFYD